MSQQGIPCLALTRTLSGTVVANRFVSSVGAQTAADANALGVCRTAGVSGDLATIDVLGTAIVEAGAAITAGVAVKADSLGRAIAWVTSGCRLGIALQAAGAAGDLIEVALIPNAGYTT